MNEILESLSIEELEVLSGKVWGTDIEEMILYDNIQEVLLKKKTLRLLESLLTEGE